ncbi:MAG: chloride channel protein [Planctomycetes bacterium]|nr:chloride channel protein [Planctomycetota bacterium]
MESRRPEHRGALAPLAQWLLLGAAIGAICGGASALFLALLERVTELRERQAWLPWLLPIGGLALGALQQRFGRPVARGSDLVVDAIHDGGPQLPWRMAPLVLFGTLATHLFGGSAGREGTAVQMGAGLADGVAHRLRLAPATRRALLVAGVAGGFGSVFGTPLAGALFSLEFVVRGRLEYHALVPALVAALVGDLVTRSCGIAHAAFPSVAALPLTPALFAKWLLFAVALALAARLFLEATHGARRAAARWLPHLALRMAAGGAALLFLWQLFGSEPLGLSLPTLARAFVDPALPTYAFAVKLLFTAVTLGAGFLGGEVTPLFVIGATLGNTVGQLLGLPLAMAAGVGMAALFAAAARTPLALIVMAAELLGAAVLPHVAIVAVVASLLCGQKSIYPAQRLLDAKP